MNLLITGGAGFIGVNLVRYWLEHHPEDTVVALDRLAYGCAGLDERLAHANLRFVHGDAADADMVRRVFGEHGIGGVIHAAAQSHVDTAIADPETTLRDNVWATFRLLEAMRRLSPQGRFHLISTDEVFGQLGAAGYFDESTPYAPDNPYSASKAAADHLVRAYHHTYGLDVVITNCSNNYGPFQYADKFIPRMIRQALRDEPLPVYGKGENVRDWLYVGDHCRAIDVVFHRAEPGETYCIGGNNEWRNIDLVRLLCRLVDERLGRRRGASEQLITFVPDRPGHDFRYAIHPGKVERDLGWKPIVPFEEGLARTVDWYLEHREWMAAVRRADLSTA
jgi:dTDP-glucose 4,6-dehydratase